MSGNHRIDELDWVLHRAWRRHIRPQMMGYQHNVLNLDLLWHFNAAGLDDAQINGHLILVSPGDTRIPVEEGQAYAVARYEQEIQGLQDLWAGHSEALIDAGASQAEFDELLDLKRARYEYLQGEPERVRQVMEVFPEPLMILRGTKPEIHPTS